MGRMLQRRREMAIRLALGANRLTPSNVTTMILRETTVVAIPGIVFGVILHLVFSQLMKGLIYHVSPTDSCLLGRCRAAGVKPAATYFIWSGEGSPVGRSARLAGGMMKRAEMLDEC